MCTNLKDNRKHEDWMICQIGLCRGWAVLMVPRGCLERKVCYGTDGVTCKQVDSTTNKCESWMTTSGWFLHRRWQPGKSATLPSHGSAETAAVAAYRLVRTIPNSQLYTSTGGEIGDSHMSRIDGEKYLLLQQGSFNFSEVHSAGSVQKIALEFHYDDLLETSSREFPCFHTLLRPFCPAPKACYPAKHRSLELAWRGLHLSQQDGQRLTVCQRRMKFLPWGLGFLWSLMRRCTLKSWWRNQHLEADFKCPCHLQSGSAYQHQTCEVSQGEDFEHVTSQLGFQQVGLVARK